MPRAASCLVYGAVDDCDVPACVRPEHLFLGTLQDNNDDMQRKARGKPYGRGGKLTADDVRAIRQNYGTPGWSAPEIARRLGVTNEAIYAIIERRNWAHLSD